MHGQALEFKVLNKVASQLVHFVEVVTHVKQVAVHTSNKKYPNTNT